MGNMNGCTVDVAADILTNAIRANAAINEFLQTLSPEDKEKEVVKKALEVIDKASYSIGEMRGFIGRLCVG